MVLEDGERLALFTFICMLLLVTAQVFFRYVLQGCTVPSTEGGSVVFRLRDLPRVRHGGPRGCGRAEATLILERLPGRLKAAVECIIAVERVIFFGGIAYRGAVMMWTVSAVRAQLPHEHELRLCRRPRLLRASRPPHPGIS